MAYSDFQSYLADKYSAEIKQLLYDFVNTSHDGNGFHSLNVVSLCKQEIDNIETKYMQCTAVGKENRVNISLHLTADIVTLGLGTSRYEADRKSTWFTVHLECILSNGLHDVNFTYAEEYFPEHYERDNGFSEFMLPYISTEKLEDVADAFFEKYCLDAIYDAWMLPYSHIMRKMGIYAVKAELPDNVFGRMYFRKDKARVLQNYYPLPKEMVDKDIEAGTMLININHYFMGSMGSELNTIAHELMHWELHRGFFEILSLISDDSKMLSCEATPSIPMEDMTGVQKAIWCAEWQANALAPRVLMPRELFFEVFEMCLDNYVGEECFKCYGEILETALEDLAKAFGVSRYAAKQRAIQLGIKEAEGTFLYCNKNMYLYPFTFRRNSLNENQTYIIDEDSFKKELKTNQKLAKAIESGDFVFVECAVCINDPLYVETDDRFPGIFFMTDYARNNAHECLMVFEREYRREGGLSQEFYAQCYLSKKIEAVPFVSTTLTDDIGNQDKIERAIELKKLRENNMAVAKVLRDLPSSFSGSLAWHMGHSKLSGKNKVSSLWLANETGLSEGYIDQLRNEEKRVSLEVVCAICIALHLQPPYSKDLIRKSHNGFLNDDEGLFGQQLIEEYYREPLDDINEVLEEQGYRTWGKTL